MWCNISMHITTRERFTERLPSLQCAMGSSCTRKVSAASIGRRWNNLIFSCILFSLRLNPPLQTDVLIRYIRTREEQIRMEWSAFSLPNKENWEGEQEDTKSLPDHPSVLHLQDAREF